MGTLAVASLASPAHAAHAGPPTATLGLAPDALEPTTSLTADFEDDWEQEGWSRSLPAAARVVLSRPPGPGPLALQSGKSGRSGSGHGAVPSCKSGRRWSEQCRLQWKLSAVRGDLTPFCLGLDCWAQRRQPLSAPCARGTGARLPQSELPGYRAGVVCLRPASDGGFGGCNVAHQGSYRPGYHQTADGQRGQEDGSLLGEGGQAGRPSLPSARRLCRRFKPPVILSTPWRSCLPTHACLAPPTISCTAWPGMRVCPHPPSACFFCACVRAYDFS
jgi:hypothetical protein